MKRRYDREGQNGRKINCEQKQGNTSENSQNKKYERENLGSKSGDPMSSQS